MRLIHPTHRGVRCALATAKSRRGATLIELMVVVAVVAIFSVPLLFMPQTPVALGVTDRAHAVALLRAQSARLAALPPAGLAMRDGAGFDADLPGLATLPNAVGTLRVRPYGAAGLLRVELRIAWKRRAGEPQALSVATLRRTGGAP